MLHCAKTILFCALKDIASEKIVLDKADGLCIIKGQGQSCLVLHVLFGDLVMGYFLQRKVKETWLNTDIQKQKCYDWEDSIFKPFQAPKLNQDEITKLAYQIADDFKVPRPVLKFNMRTSGAKVRMVAFVHFNPEGTSRHIVIHEMAHYTNATNDRHGPQFMRNMIELDSIYGHLTGDKQFSVDVLFASAVNFGLAVHQHPKFGKRSIDMHLDVSKINDALDDWKV